MIRSTFAGFTTAKTAMDASQQALRVVGQNIANVNTDGYTRQRVDVVSLNLNGGSQYNSSNRIGYGVEVTGISQIRDPFLDVQYRNQTAKVGAADSRQDVLNQLANIFDETNKEALKTSISNISSALSTFSNNVSLGDSAVRANFQTLLNIVHQKSNDLSNVREENIGDLEKTNIPTVNSLMSDIGELSNKIWNCQIQGDSALELKDQRNNKLDELASYLPISVSYKSVNIADGATYDYPVVKFTGSDGLTYNLLSGEHGENSASLSVERNLDSNGDEDGTVSISLTPASDYAADADMSSLKTDITDTISSGSLKGTLDMLNKSGQLDYPATDYGGIGYRGIGYYEKALDSFVNTLAETFNELNKNTKPYTGVTSIPTSGAAVEVASAAATDKAKYSIDFQSTSGNFLNGEKIEINGQSYEFGDGSGSTVAIGSDLDTTLNNLVGKMNTPDNLEVNGTSLQGSWGYNSTSKKLTWTSTINLTAGDTIDSNSIKTSTGDALSITYTANSSNVKSYDLFKTTDGSDDFTASNIDISDAWMSGDIQILPSQKDGAGSTANDNILRMINALTTERDFTSDYTYEDSSGTTKSGVNTVFTCSIQGFYSKLESVQGIDSSSNKAILANHKSVLKETANNKDSVSGVSLDEEGIDLLRFQKSYTAAARLMTTLDEALDVLINNTGKVGR